MSERARHHDHAARRWALGALLCGLAACGGGSQAGFVATNPPPRPMRARPAAEVALIVDKGQMPPREHVEVGWIEVLGDDEWGAAEQAAMRETLRARAAERGCDAVVLLGEIDWVYVIESARSTSQRHGYRGVCVVYR